MKDLTAATTKENTAIKAAFEQYCSACIDGVMVEDGEMFPCPACKPVEAQARVARKLEQSSLERLPHYLRPAWVR